MPRTGLIGRFERRLVELGCPEPKLRRQVEELADHHDDLKFAALEEGLSEAEAEIRADELLGNPATLAERAVAGLQHCSWWGRHRIIGFCLLPPLGFLAAWLVWMLLFGGFFSLMDCIRPHASEAWGSVFSRELERSKALVLALNLALNSGMIVLVAALFCHFALRSTAGLRCAVIACAVCAAQGIFFHAVLVPHSLAFGYGLHPNWVTGTSPLLVAGLVWLRQRQTCLTLIHPLTDTPCQPLTNH